MTMRDEAPEAFASGFTDEAPDARDWIPEPPDDDGWFLGSPCLLLVPSDYKRLTPPYGVVVQPRERGKASFPRPRRFFETVKEIA